MRQTLRGRFVFACLASAAATIAIAGAVKSLGLGWIQQVVLALLAAWLVGVLAAGRTIGFLAAFGKRLDALLAGEGRRWPPLRSADPLLDHLSRGLDELEERLNSAREEAARGADETQSILDDLADAVIAVDDQARVVRANPAAGVYLGQIPHSSMLGRTLLEVSLNHMLDEIVRAALRGKAAQLDSIDLHAPVTRPVSVSVIPRLTFDGECEGAVVVLHDISEARRTDRVRQEFVANASHELRTPVASIRVMAESLLNGGLEDPELAGKFARSIADSSERLTRLVDDLLFLSVKESGGSGDEESVDLAETARSVCDKLSPQAAELGLSLACGDSEAAVVQGDPLDLWRAVANIVDNAMRYTDSGGSIRVSATVCGEEAVVTVTDTGLGIPPEEQEKIFERFYRVHLERSRATGGTGLGLSIVRHIARSCGGRVEVESTVGEGSSFRLIIPLVEAEVEAG